MSSVFQEIVNLIFTIIVIPAFATLTILFLMYLHSKVVQYIYFNEILPKIRAAGKVFYYAIGYVSVWVHEHSHAELSKEVYDISVSPEEGYVVSGVVDSIHEMLVALGPSIIPPILAGILTLFFYNNFTSSVIQWGWNKSALGPTENAKTFLSWIGVDPNDRLAIPLCTFYMTFEFTMIDAFKTILNLLNINIASPYSWIYLYLIMILGLGSGPSWYDWGQVFNKYSLGIFISCGFAYFVLSFIIVLPLHYILLYGMFICLLGCFLAYLVSSYALVLRSFSWLQRITSITGFISTFILVNVIIGFDKSFLTMWFSLIAGYCITKLISSTKIRKLKLLKPKNFKLSPILIFLVALPVIYYYCPRLVRSEISAITNDPLKYDNKSIWLFGTVTQIINYATYQEGFSVEKPSAFILKDSSGEIKIDVTVLQKSDPNCEQRLPRIGDKVLIYCTLHISYSFYPKEEVVLELKELYKWDI